MWIVAPFVAPVSRPATENPARSTVLKGHGFIRAADADKPIGTLVPEGSICAGSKPLGRGAVGNFGMHRAALSRTRF